MTGLRIQLLGTFVATLDQQPLVKLSLKKAQALLIYLACHPEPHQRESLLLLLWSDMSQHAAQKNLRQTLYRLRQMIPKCPAAGNGRVVPLILSDRHTVQLNPQADYQLDVHDFTNLLKASKTHWPEALALYRGDFLTDFFLSDSADFEELSLIHI